MEEDGVFSVSAGVFTVLVFLVFYFICKFRDQRYAITSRLQLATSAYGNDVTAALRTIKELSDIEKAVARKVSDGYMVDAEMAKATILSEAKKTEEVLVAGLRKNFPAYYAASWAIWESSNSYARKERLEEKRFWRKELGVMPEYNAGSIAEKFYKKFPDIDPNKPNSSDFGILCPWEGRIQ